MKLLPTVVFVVLGIWIASAYPEVSEMVLHNVKLGIEYVSKLLSDIKGR